MSATRERTAHKPLAPFTVDHWRAYSRKLILDDGSPWEPDDFQCQVAEDHFAGAPELWLLIPEGNGKTTFMGGFSLYHADYTESASVLLAASSRDQCGLLLGQAAGFVYRTPGLNRVRFRVFEGYRRISALRTHGVIQVFAADDRTGDGVIPTLALLDELHRHRDLRLYRTWVGKLLKRGGQLVAISTAGEPSSEFEDTRARIHASATESEQLGPCYVRSVGEGIVLHDFHLTDKDKAHDLDLVKLANPLSTITAEQLRRKHDSPTMTEAHWLRFVCNIAARAEGAWLDSRVGWDQGARPGMTIEAGSEVALGLDPAWHFDTCALIAVQKIGGAIDPAEDDEQLDSHHFRVRAQPIAILKPDEGGSVPIWQLREAILDAAEHWQVLGVGYDRNRGFEQLAQELSDEHGLNMIAVPMNGAVWVPLTAEMRSAINQGDVEHPADPEFTRHVLSGETKDGPQGPRLHGRTREKVDGLMAMGIGWRVLQTFEDRQLEPMVAFR